MRGGRGPEVGGDTALVAGLGVLSVGGALRLTMGETLEGFSATDV